MLKSRRQLCIVTGLILFVVVPAADGDVDHSQVLDIAEHHDRMPHAILCGRFFPADVAWLDSAKLGQHRQLLDAIDDDM